MRLAHSVSNTVPVPTWFLWYFPVILLANMLMIWYVIKRSEFDYGAEDEDETGSVGTVRCPECSETNEARFTFCRSCLAELSN